MFAYLSSINQKQQPINTKLMKNLFLALALTGFIGAVSMNTVAAFTHAKVIMCGGEECKHKKGEKCTKGDKCCKSKTTATADKKCSKDGEKKCCSHSSAKKSTTTSETKTDSKEVEVVK